MADLAATSSISDLCFLVEDLDRAIAFYRDRVGFKLRRLAPGFADFFPDLMATTSTVTFNSGIQIFSCNRRESTNMAECPFSRRCE